MLSLLAVVAAAGLAAAAASAPATAPRVLVFTKTTGFRHDSIPAAIQAVENLGAQNGFAVDATEDAGAFTDANLAHYAAVVFLLTTGDVLDDGQQAAFERYIHAGGGWVGVHSAADTEYDWPFYGGLLGGGAWFKDHPAIQQATIDVADPRTAATSTLPARWTRTDEWYNFRADPRPSVHVLATLDESTYTGGEMGADHPTAWWHDYAGGRAWYTSGGHTTDSWSEPLFLAHVLGGIEYAIAKTSAPGPAKIASLTASLRGRRAVVTVRYTGCTGCTGTLRVGKRTVPLKLNAGVASGTGPVLARGHVRLYVVLSGGGVRLTASRPLVVR